MCPSVPTEPASSCCPEVFSCHLLVSLCHCHRAVTMGFCLPSLPAPKHQPSLGASLLPAFKSLDVKASVLVFCWFSVPAPCFLTHLAFCAFACQQQLPILLNRDTSFPTSTEHLSRDLSVLPLPAPIFILQSGETGRISNGNIHLREDFQLYLVQQPGSPCRGHVPRRG